MGQATEAEKVKLVVGMIAKDTTLFKEAEEALKESYGPVDYESPVMDFNYTDYYQEEFGDNLKRKFVAFKEAIGQGELAQIKVDTISIERQFLVNGKRRINLDPGYLSHAKFVLATTKDYQHRIYLKDGIYAEITLAYRDGSYRPNDWTYADYRTKGYIDVFNRLRQTLY